MVRRRRDVPRVTLAGAAGFLGAHLFRELLDRTDARIHALVRGRAEAQRRYGIHRPPPEHRVCPVLGDLPKPGLGMREAVRAEVNFLYPYEKLRAANAAGVRRVTEDTGNETTKNAGGLVAFSRNPDRWHLLRRQPGLLNSAVEETLRYTSVIQHVTRTALRLDGVSQPHRRPSDPRRVDPSVRLPDP